MALTESERDNLLVRLDERTCNIWKEITKQEKHMAEQNGYIREALVCSRVNSRAIKTITAVGGTGLAAIITKVLEVW